MLIQELKTIIESGNVPDGLTIWKYSDSGFIPNQYIDFIKTTHSVRVVNSYEECIDSNIDIFSLDNEDVKVLRIEVFDCIDERLKECKKTIIICKKINKQSQNRFENFVVEIPKIEPWQIEDYVYSIADGINQKDLKKLVDVCNNNIYRLDLELQKIKLFPKEQRQFLFNKFIEEDVFSDLSSYNIFDITNCIIKKDIKKLFSIYIKLDNIDVEPIGLLTLLCQNFKNIIDVQLSVNSSAEALGMKSNQYWAIKYSCGFYTKEELVKIYSFLTSIDKKIKTGEMPMEHLVDYIIIKVITCV